MNTNLKPEAEFAAKAFELYLRSINSTEELAKIAHTLFCREQWIRQFFADNIKCEAASLATLQTQNAEMRNHIEQLKALNNVLRSDVEELKIENSQLKQQDYVLKNESYIKAWSHLQDAKTEIHGLLFELEDWDEIDVMSVDWTIQVIVTLLNQASSALPGQESPPEV